MSLVRPASVVVMRPATPYMATISSAKTWRRSLGSTETTATLRHKEGSRPKSDPRLALGNRYSPDSVITAMILKIKAAVLSVGDGAVMGLTSRDG
jgi:hypothetical protein